MKSRALVFLAVSCCAFAQTPPQKVTSVEGITEYRLANGLRVLLFPDPSKPTITVNMTYLVGSRNENYGEKGMAHLLEHLMFKGSTNHKNVPQELTVHGSRPNGTTYFDRTNYFETFQATPENLNWALDLEADRMINSFIVKKDLDSEMTVVRNEFESGENSPERVLFERVLSSAYLWHNYGHSTIGARSDIEVVPIDRLQAFWRNYYQPDNAVLMVAGKIDEAKTLALVEKYYGGIPRPTRSLQQTYTVEPTQDGERSVILRRVGDSQGLMAVYHTPAGSDPDFAAVDVLGWILGNAPAGRLYKALVETKKAASVEAGAEQLRDPGVLIAGARVPKDKSLDDARDTLLKTVEALPTDPPTEAEVDRAKSQMLRDIDLSLNNSERIALNLSEWASMGDWRLFFWNRDQLRKVTAADVARVARLYLKSSNRTLGEFIPTTKPDRTEVPKAPDVMTLLKDYKGSTAAAAGEDFDPSPINIDKRTIRGDVQPGVKLALISKKTRGNSVQALWSLHFGDEKNLVNQASVGSLTAALLMRGTTKHTRQQIQDELSRMQAQVNITGGATGVTASVQTTRDHLPEALQLVGEMLREPVFPEKELEEIRQQRINMIETQKQEPQMLAMTAVSKALAPYPKGDVRYVSTPDESIADLKAVTLDQVKQFYKEYYGAEHSELSVVGDFDPEAVQTLASKLASGFTSHAHYAEVFSAYQHIAPQNLRIETPDKANAMFIAASLTNMSDEDPDYPAMVLGNYLLGGGFLNSRLATRIRQKDGLSYGVGSQFAAQTKNKYGQFFTYAISAPQNSDKVEKAFREEIARALKDGFTSEEVESGKKGWLQAQQVSRAQDQELVRRLATERHYDRTMTFDEALQNKVAALSPEQITQALRRHLNPDEITIVKAGDYKKANAGIN